MYVVGNWVEGNVDNLSFGDWSLITPSHKCSFGEVLHSDLILSPYSNLTEVYSILSMVT